MRTSLVAGTARDYFEGMSGLAPDFRYLKRRFVFGHRAVRAGRLLA